MMTPIVREAFLPSIAKGSIYPKWRELELRLHLNGIHAPSLH